MFSRSALRWAVKLISATVTESSTGPLQPTLLSLQFQRSSTKESYSLRIAKGDRHHDGFYLRELPDCSSSPLYALLFPDGQVPSAYAVQIALINGRPVTDRRVLQEELNNNSRTLSVQLSLHDDFYNAYERSSVPSIDEAVEAVLEEEEEGEEEEEDMQSLSPPKRRNDKKRKANSGSARRSFSQSDLQTALAAVKKPERRSRAAADGEDDDEDDLIEAAVAAAIRGDKGKRKPSTKKKAVSRSKKQPQYVDEEDDDESIDAAVESVMNNYTFSGTSVKKGKSAKSTKKKSRSAADDDEVIDEAVRHIMDLGSGEDNEEVWFRPKRSTSSSQSRSPKRKAVASSKKAEVFDF